MVTGGIFFQAIGHAVIDSNCFAVLIDAFGIARPGGNNRCRQGDRRLAGFEVFTHDWQ